MIFAGRTLAPHASAGVETTYLQKYFYNLLVSIRQKIAAYSTNKAITSPYPSEAAHKTHIVPGEFYLHPARGVLHSPVHEYACNH